MCVNVRRMIKEYKRDEFEERSCEINQRYLYEIDSISLLIISRRCASSVYEVCEREPRGNEIEYNNIKKRIQDSLDNKETFEVGMEETRGKYQNSFGDVNSSCARGGHSIFQVL